MECTAMVSPISTSSANFHLTAGGRNLKLTHKCSELKCLCDTSSYVLQGKYNIYEAEETGVWLCAKLWRSFHSRPLFIRFLCSPTLGILLSPYISGHSGLPEFSLCPMKVLV